LEEGRGQPQGCLQDQADIYRKLARRKGSSYLRRITVFVRHENVLRLLKFLGYSLE
jgi:hypothetical protein